MLEHGGSGRPARSSLPSSRFRAYKEVSATLVAGGVRQGMLRSRLTERLKLEHPVISAPMGFVGGGKLAAAVSAAGGLA